VSASRSEPTITVVMPTYNRAAGLERVVRPLLEDPATRELIVVVDGSRDGSVELLEGIASSDPRLRPLFIENSGDMGARDAGARAATGEVLLFVDDDVLAEPGLVGGHARRHAGTEGRVVLGYMPVLPGPARTPGDFATRLYAAEYEGRCAVYEHDPVSVLRELWGGNFSMRREDCLAVGMANPAYDEHYEADRDFGIRCLESGLSGVFDRSLRATHLHTRTLPAWARDARSQGAARVLMNRLHAATTGPLERDRFERSLPGPARAVIRLGRRPRAYAGSARALRWIVAATGLMRLWGAQALAARLLRRLEQQRGAIERTQGRRGRGA
jgi:glycosyltransferase involved in cell wall biosynthesis